MWFLSIINQNQFEYIRELERKHPCIKGEIKHLQDQVLFGCNIES